MSRSRFVPAVLLLGLSGTAFADFKEDTRLLVQKREWPGLQVLTEREIGVHPNSTEAHFFLGIALVNLGRPEPALAQFKRATELEPRSIAAWYNLALCSASLGRREQTLEALDRLGQLEYKLGTMSPYILDADFPMKTLALTRNPEVAKLLCPEPPIDYAPRKAGIRNSPVPPRMPFAAKEKGIQGDVVVQVTVDPSGVPIDVHATKGPVELHQIAEEYALWWRWVAPKDHPPGKNFRFDMIYPWRFSGSVIKVP